jgi:hypothetical protein
MHQWPRALLVTAIACGTGTRGERDTAEADGARVDCEAYAIRDRDGNPDGCDVDACDACTDACPTSCQIFESYPPQYACRSDGNLSFSVFDFCPDWTHPSTAPVDQVP